MTNVQSTCKIGVVYVITALIDLPAQGPAQMQAPEIQIVEKFRVSCDGSEGALGHPRVWLQIPDDLGWVACPYCDCKFIQKEFEGKV
ncbi:MAG: putative Zn-finger protein [Ascidiaceihabitans sp.]